MLVRELPGFIYPFSPIEHVFIAEGLLSHAAFSRRPIIQKALKYPYEVINACVGLHGMRIALEKCTLTRINMEIKFGQIIVLLTSMLIFTLGFGIIIPVIPYYVRDMGASALDNGLLMATMSAAQLIFAPVWGRISDRIGRKPVMITGLIGFGLSFLWLALATDLWMLYVAQLIGGAISAGIWPACLAYIADISSPGERGKYMGLMGAASGAGMIFGPAISSFFTTWGLTAPFYAAAAIGFITAAFTFIFLSESRKPLANVANTKKLSMSTAFRSHLAVFFFIMLFSSFALACMDATFTYFIMDKFGISETASPMPFLTGHLTLSGPAVSGIIFTFMGIVLVVTQGFIVGRSIQMLGEEKTILAGLMLMIAGFILVLIAPELITLTLFVCLLSIGISIIQPCLNTLISKRTDADNQGAMLGLLGSFNSLGRVFGPIAGGAAYTIAMSLPYIGSAVISGIAAAAIHMESSKNEIQDITDA